MSGPFMSTRGTVWMSMSKDQIGFGWRRFSKAVVVVAVVVDVVVKRNKCNARNDEIKAFWKKFTLRFLTVGNQQTATTRIVHKWRHSSENNFALSVFCLARSKKRFEKNKLFFFLGEFWNAPFLVPGTFFYQPALKPDYIESVRSKSKLNQLNCNN